MHESAKFFDILENKNVRYESNNIDHNFEISHHFMVGLKKCGRVTTTIVTTCKDNVFIVFTNNF